MTSFELEIWDNECDKVTFYSPKVEGAAMSEMEKFLHRMEQRAEMVQPLQELLELILGTIGNQYGADEAFFNRFENKVTALPPKGYIKLSELKIDYRGFPLRLYCLRLSEEIVILFDGGIKTAQTAQASEISMKFFEANEFGGRIQDALHAGMIVCDRRTIRDFNGNSEIIL